MKRAKGLMAYSADTTTTTNYFGVSYLFQKICSSKVEEMKN